MIDERKLAELRRAYVSASGIPLKEIDEMLDTLDALWKFKEAMKEMIEWSPRQMTVALMRREIRKALAALDDGKEKG